MTNEEKTTDRYKLSQFYKGKDFETNYVKLQQFDNAKINSENIHIQSLSFLYNTLKSKDKVEINSKWTNLFPKLDKVKRLKITFGINQDMFNIICEIPNLEELIIDTSKVIDLTQLENIKNLNRLEIDSFTKLTNISILEKIKLKQLRIENCFKIENYEIVEKIESLIGLSLNGYCWGPKNLKIKTIEQFVKLKNLKHLDLSTTSLEDKNSIFKILEIESLERFDITGSFKPEIVEEIKRKHSNLVAGFFTDWDFKNKKMFDGKSW
ncbi:hypothetical protein SAMN05443549_1011085 [Flavobacterium fluvii]|uniref:Leucine Rich repeat-containing protein n=1 Tax=Flavobacterium fluvii TaxID=468056 RepID=A0A1M5G3Z9_9FLAO|nr:hypothetical protein [Flavobacterium fluvii]SHF98530.1 hypothetical protein SAMN05443549_1011085 [Flavobacterium fluvii]